MREKPYHHLPRNRTVEIAPGVSLEFVLVLPGTFVMGDAQIGVGPEHRVRVVQPFYLGRYPVMQGQWAAVMGNKPVRSAENGGRPIDSVSWDDIVVKSTASWGFLARLSEVQGYTYRLPTEAEWEYAAKGGHLAPQADERVHAENLYPTYAGGDNANTVAWQEGINEYSALRTGYRQPNDLGLYGMSGNVWEWCQDNYDYEAYARRAQIQRQISDPLEEGFGLSRVVRGGSWFASQRLCRPAYRNGRQSSIRDPLYGFRLLLAPD